MLRYKIGTESSAEGKPTRKPTVSGEKIVNGDGVDFYRIELPDIRTWLGPPKSLSRAALRRFQPIRFEGLE